MHASVIKFVWSSRLSGHQIYLTRALPVSLPTMTPPLIALEEHFYSQAVFDAIGSPFQRTLKAVPGLIDQLREVGDGRLAAMDRGQIALQVVSHAFTPGSTLHSDHESSLTDSADGICDRCRQPWGRRVSKGQR